MFIEQRPPPLSCLLLLLLFRWPPSGHICSTCSYLVFLTVCKDITGPDVVVVTKLGLRRTNFCIERCDVTSDVNVMTFLFFFFFSFFLSNLSVGYRGDQPLYWPQSYSCTNTVATDYSTHNATQQPWRERQRNILELKKKRLLGISWYLVSQWKEN